uniref:Uncharacterized protein LOC111117496 isoform X6 n=1 Tax=Crassostrea virginica TaxID=6565 RepID=A0A8B8CB29_CRAVI|nr:uncharacterized protein LOC111117496 isoform X6 [Crassostrea virginica]
MIFLAALLFTTQVAAIIMNSSSISEGYCNQDYAGKCIIFSTHCQNQTLIPDHVSLIPCLSGFTGNATVVGSNVHLYCEHSSFNESTSGIRITHKENTLVQCNKNHTCYPGSDLPNGAYRKFGYRKGMVFLCRMDGAIINLKIIVVASTSTTNTFSTTPMFSHDTSASTSQSSPSMSTFLVIEGNGARHIAVDSFVTLSAIVIYLFLLISS